MTATAWIITLALLLFHQGSAQFLEPDCGVVSDPINGVRPNPTPWLALIRSDTRKCSGVLIHKQYVITAASCLINNTETLVRLGDFDGFPQNENVKYFPYEEYYIKTANIHYMFDEIENLENLALLKLPMKVTYKRHIRPICVLLNSANKATVDTLMEFDATLCGLNEMRPFPKPKINIISRLNAIDCIDVFNSPQESSQICAAFESGASCLEQGSPLSKMLIHNDKELYNLYGIQSYGTFKTCVYTDIISYVDWIVENVLEVHVINLKHETISD
ncbi:hypothetical protein KR032_006114 [Drosophila birchii]|nr:hypothetical protein KR032_006114 [Drosophila birchii]